ncbi:MAG: alpha/beta hydrolase [Mycobacterium sp.]|nr:alpha/beta hydrolase [Mycobacterium sp.]
MAEFTRDGATIHYTDTGIPRDRPGAATIFFGHGLLFGGWMFGPQIASLKNDYRCVAIDWRGQGASSAPAGGYDMDTLAEDAIALIGELGVGPVHYVGLSMGGFIGQRIAARHSELVRSLTLLDTSAGPEDPDKVRQYKLMGAAYRFVGIGPLRKAVLPLMFPARAGEPLRSQRHGGTTRDRHRPHPRVPRLDSPSVSRYDSRPAARGRQAC